MRSTMRWMIALAAIACAPGTGLSQSPPHVSLPDAIPIFPLPDVALFPKSVRPFHIYEQRYRAMVADALEGDRIIGMILLQPGYETQYEGRPPVYAVGCAGVIVESVELPDGRYDIVLQGVAKFQIVSEDTSRPYRLAEIEELPDAMEEAERPLLALKRQLLEDALLSAFPNAELPPAGLPDEEVIDGLSLALPLEPAERQELLEADGSMERASSLLRLIAKHDRPGRIL